MKLEERITSYKQQTFEKPEEAWIQEAIAGSKEIFYQKEQERMLNYREFLWSQFRLIRKRWWMFQTMLLLLAGWLLPFLQETYDMQKSIGVTGVLFVILIIPELWKNRNSFSMEVEGSAYYSLRQIYAARMLLFGIVDVCLLTVFCAVLRQSLQVALTELVVQFLFPAVVTACICFGVLCSQYVRNELTAIALCMMWSGLWWMITLQENIYEAIVFPAWMCLFGSAVLILAAVIFRTIRSCDYYWEGTLNGIEID